MRGGNNIATLIVCDRWATQNLFFDLILHKEIEWELYKDFHVYELRIMRLYDPFFV